MVLRLVNIKAAFFFLVFFLSACQKDDFTLPSDVTISFGTFSEQAMDGNLAFTASEIKIESIRLVGERNVSNDIDFMKSSPFDVPPDLFDASLPPVLVNVPQGIYDRFDLHLSIGQGTGDYADVNSLIDEWIEKLNDYLDDSDDDGDGDDDGDNDGDEDGYDDLFELQGELGVMVNAYRNDIHPGFRIEGSILIEGLPLTVIFAVDDAFNIHLPVLNASGSRELSFEADKTNNIAVEFDPESWFAPLSIQVLRNAWIGTSQGQNFLFIHKKINPQLYTILLSRLGDSFKTSKSR